MTKRVFAVLGLVIGALGLFAIWYMTREPEPEPKSEAFKTLRDAVEDQMTATLGREGFARRLMRFAPIAHDTSEAALQSIPRVAVYSREKKLSASEGSFMLAVSQIHDLAVNRVRA